MIRKLVVTVVVLVLAVPLLVLAAAATRPATYLVQRSILVAAPPGPLYAAVADFRRWERWSPWARLDPDQEITVVGAGLGSVYTWSGDSRVGAGRMTIVETVPGSKVAIKLEFLRPFASTSETSFLVVPEGAGSRLTWLMKGHLDLVGRAMSIFKDMDGMIGPDFERGLASLKAEAERPGP